MTDWFTEMATEVLNNFGSELSLNLARDREQIFQDFLRLEKGFNGDKLAFLDRGIKNSCYQEQVPLYPERLTQTPEFGIPGTPNYPPVGEMPEIDEQGLDFLHPDIKHACICLAGATSGGPFQSRWLGRNALDKEQFWSTTKIIPILDVLCQLEEPVQACQVCEGETCFNLVELIEDVVSYGEKVGSSNAISAMFKRFKTYNSLEHWVSELTGNTHLEFRGLYGEEPLLEEPQVIKNGQVLLSPAPVVTKGENLMTAYDLTRFMSMIGYDHHLPTAAKFPHLKTENLNPLVIALGLDSARYVDLALERLGIDQLIQAPVILSKLGFGYSSSRRRTELTYSCFTQFEFRSQRFSIALSLRGAKALGSGKFHQEAVEIDARMAAEVTEILRRLVMGEL